MAEETAQEYRERVARAGGHGRAKKMTPKQRSDAARKAVEARWKKVEELGESVRKKSDDLVKPNRRARKRKSS